MSIPPPGGPPPVWPPQPGSPSPYSMPPQSSNATLILILGILSIVFGGCGVILGPIAWVMGNNALAQLNAGVGNPSELGTINAGRICGIIGTVLSALIIVVYGGLFALGIASGIKHPTPAAP